MAKSKLNILTQKDIAQRYKAGETSSALALEYNVSYCTILNYVRKHGGKVRTLKEHGKYYITGEEAAKNSKYKKYKAAAKYRKLHWNLTKEEFFDIASKNCFYCGTPPSNINVSDSGWGKWKYSGLDRKDSSIGYITSNVVPACIVCNRAKSDMSYNDFMAWIKRLRT